MDMNKKREIRKNQKEEVPFEQQANKTNINWFPGHMTKAKREMEEKIKVVDMVIEIRDSRVPFASQNPLLNSIIGNKPRLIILSKKDKSENSETEKWINYFNTENTKAIALNLLNNKSVSKIVSDACLKIMEEKIAKLKAKGMKRVEIKAMVVGIPNVGKSTLINSISNKKVAKTGDKPGVTKSLQWIKVSPEVALLDTPGVLWPKFDDQQIGFVLAITGAINDAILPMQHIVEYAMEFLMKHHKEKLEKRYDIVVGDIVHENIDAIAKARGTLLNDGSYDYDRLYTLILRDIRDNQLGPITWELVDEVCK